MGLQEEEKRQNSFCQKQSKALEEKYTFKLVKWTELR